jgi:hypothetical protein
LTGKLALGVALAALIVALTGCAVEATYTGHIEVWNRTVTPVKVIGQGATLTVPACGHVVSDEFVLNSYDIVDDQGRFIARHGGGGSNPSNVTPVYEMVTSEGAVYSDSTPPPEPLPPCEGVIQGQST